jgi:3-deoxy-7-phosphoheptulonate synthase
MHQPTADLRIRAIKPLLAPAILEEEVPVDDARAELIARSRREVAAIMNGRDDRLLVVVGPCSIHDPVAALDYAARLKAVVPLYAADLLLVMRVYFEKPRTVVGWKGLINDPALDGSYQINHGLRLARRLMADITGLGLPVATEFLDTTLGQYYADLVSWGAIGARTVESQVHRELASGLSMPVGFKNRTDGDLQVAVDAIRSAQHPHWFPSLTREGAPAVLGTAGNEPTATSCCAAAQPRTQLCVQSRRPRRRRATASKTSCPRSLMVDCSHANSGKDPTRQPEVAAAELAAQIAAGERALTARDAREPPRSAARRTTRRSARSTTAAASPTGASSWEQRRCRSSRILAEAVRARRKH